MLDAKIPIYIKLSTYFFLNISCHFFDQICFYTEEKVFGRGATGQAESIGSAFFEISD